MSFSHSDKRWRKWYNVKCDCNNELTVIGSSLVSGNTKSCGCLAKEIKASKRISNNHSEVTAIILGYKRHAESRGFSWLLNRDDVLGIIDKPCFYCLNNPSNVKKTKNSIDNGLVYSGIDRINSLLHYTVDNVVSCCRICNYAKSNLTLDEFQEWAINLGKNAMAVQWSSYACR
jgi:5-methylcytosine-specific restriction endonuclease McrA